MKAALVHYVSGLAPEVERPLAADAPALASAGGVIRPGADPELDSLRELRKGAQTAVLAVEAEERRRSGISTLRVRFNRVFGYSLEVGAAHRDRVPADWIRRQSLANAERFVTPALKELEGKILGAEERIAEIETRMYGDLLVALARGTDRLSRAAASLAGIDLHASLAEVAHSGRWVRPRLSATPRISIVDGRHPLVEHHRREEPFVPNDCDLSPDRRILVLTGPNMGGKSTYLRQVGTIVLLAQVGSFVPATKAELSPVDRIFTRVGAADHLSRGESTFMVEMLEAAAIQGDTVRTAVLARVLESGQTELLDAIDEAARTGFLCVYAPGGRLEFDSGVVRGSILAGLPLPERVSLHRRTALAIEDLAAGRVANNLGELTYHWSAAASVGASAEASLWARRAADEAKRVLAFGEAERLYGLALEYADGIFFIAENPSTTLHKISEIYDRIAFAGVGKFN